MVGGYLVFLDFSGQNVVDVSGILPEFQPGLQGKKRFQALIF